MSSLFSSLQLLITLCLFLACENNADVELTFNPSDNSTDTGEDILTPQLEEESFGSLLFEETTLRGATAGDYFGCAISTGDIDGDGNDEILAGAYGHDQNGIHSGAAYLFSQPFDHDNAIVFVGPEPKDHAGMQVLLSPDISGDQRADIIISAPYNKNIYIFRSQSIPMLSSVISLDEADHIIIGENAGDYIGWSLSSVSDIDGDGNHELLIGADGVDYGSFSGGMTYLLFSQTLEVETRFNIEIANRKFVGDQPLDNAGQAVSSGDIDGDGLGDIIIGADGNDSGAENGGAVFINYGAGLMPADLPLSISDVILYSQAPFTEAGSSLASGQDANGDGYDDILIGAPAPERQSQSPGYVFFIAGGNISSQILEDAPLQFVGNYDNTGYSVNFVKDIDQDDRADILIGAPMLHSDTQGGRSYFWPSHTLSSGSVHVAQSPYAFVNEEQRARAGMSVGSLQYDDQSLLLVGSPQEQHTGSVSILRIE